MTCWGVDQSRTPRFVRRYVDGERILTAALDQYDADVKEARFPDLEESYSLTRVFDDPAAWRRERRELARAGLTVGFVPTMGALHEGHLSLVRRSRSENDRTLVSIFVNPTQFDDPADLARYPGPLDADLAALRGEGTDFVLLPARRISIATGSATASPRRECSTALEGAHRPGHFDGVLTVVMKLLQIAQPERAYFGEKDWQQLSLVRGMVDAFFLPVTIVGCPTVRDADGLALSSRNSNLRSGRPAAGATRSTRCCRPRRRPTRRHAS